MIATEKPVLDKLKELLTFEANEYGRPRIYVDPYDRHSFRQTDGNFVVVRVSEDSSRDRSKTDFRGLSSTYEIVIRWILHKGDLDPSSKEFAPIELKALEIIQALDGMLAGNQTLDGTVLGIGADGVFSSPRVVFIMYDSDLYVGVEYSFFVTQMIK